MRFKMRLTEKISSNIIKKIIDNYNKYVEKLNKQPGAYDKSPDIINSVIMKAIKDADDRFRNDLKDMVPVIATSIKEKGTQNNRFLKFLSIFPDEKLLANNADKLSYINQLYIRNYIDLNSNGSISVNGKQVPYIYLQPSLYDKSLEDFKYIANAFALLSDDYYVKKHFDNPETVNLQSFYRRDGSVRDKGDIYRKIDDWYYKSGAKRDNAAKDISSSGEKKFTLTDLFREGIGKNKQPSEYISYLWSKYNDRISSQKAYDIINSNLGKKDKIYDNVIDGAKGAKIFSDITKESKVVNDLFQYIISEIGIQYSK